MRVSLLVSSYNGTADLPDLLASITGLDRGGHEVEVIIRDDASPQGGAGEIVRAYPDVTLIEGAENLGFAKSNNVLLERATGDVICCVNQDTILHPGFLLGGIRLLEGRPDAAGVNANMLMPWVMSREDFLADPRQRFPCYEYQLTPFGFTRYVPVEPEVRETTFLSGGAFFLRRSALRSGEKLFDPRIHMYCEDTELSLRLSGRGARFLYAPEAVVYHNQAPKAAGSAGALRKLLAITTTRMNVLARHYGPAGFTVRFPLFLLGIVGKMGYLGLSRPARFMAYGVGILLAAAFGLSLPYWLYRTAVDGAAAPPAAT